MRFEKSWRPAVADFGGIGSLRILRGAMEVVPRAGDVRGAGP